MEKNTWANWWARTPGKAHVGQLAGEGDSWETHVGQLAGEGDCWKSPRGTTGRRGGLLGKPMWDNWRARE